MNTNILIIVLTITNIVNLFSIWFLSKRIELLELVLFSLVDILIGHKNKED